MKHITLVRELTVKFRTEKTFVKTLVNFLTLTSPSSYQADTSHNESVVTHYPDTRSSLSGELWLSVALAEQRSSCLA